MNKKLKKCPFCGGNAQFVLVSVEHDGYNAKGNYKLKCGKCGVCLPRIFKLEIGFSKDGNLDYIVDERAAAIEEWNRRHGADE